MTVSPLPQTPAAHEDGCRGACRACVAPGSCPSRLVCRCQKVTEESVIAAIQQDGVRSVVELKKVTRAGDGCTCCHKQLRVYLDVYAPASPSSSPLPICSAR